MKPNILFFFTDQQRWDSCGCYGQKLDTTPNLDALAKEGVQFQHAFTPQPVCGPARACLQTGRYASEIGVHTNICPLPTDTPLLANQMRKAGYEAAYIGKWHLASDWKADRNLGKEPVPPELRGGYDDYWLASEGLEATSHSYDGHMFDGEGNQREFPEGQYRVDVQTDWAIDYLKTRKKEKPFFLFLSYIEPHHQNDHGHYEGPKGSKERFKDYEIPGDLVGTEGDWKEELPDYFGCVRSLDDNLGRIIDHLKETGEWENTLLVFTTDHGSHFRTRNKEYKRSCHEASIRIPMVIHGPGFNRGQVMDELVDLLDLPPTLLEAAGADVPEEMRGQPLQQLLADSKDWKKDIFVQTSEAGVGRVLRTHRWKYALKAPHLEWSMGESGLYHEAFLYDLENDPHERENLIDDPAFSKVRKELRAALLERMNTIGERPCRILSEAEYTLEHRSTRTLDRRFKAIFRQSAYAASTAEEHQAWAAGARQKLAGILSLDKLKPVDAPAEWVDEIDCGDHLRQRLRIQVEDGVWMPFYVLTPKDGKAQHVPVIALHGHGMGGKVGIVGAAYSKEHKEHVAAYNCDYGLKAVRQGFKVFCPDSRGFGERREYDDIKLLWHSCKPLNAMSIAMGLSVAGLMVWDACRLVDYITSRDDVFAEKLICMGLSGGGLQTLYTTAMDERIRAAIISGYFYGVKESFLEMRNCDCNYVPGLWEQFDHGDLAALIAPRPLLIQTGDQDGLNGASGVANVLSQVDVARSAYRLLGAEKNLTHHIFEGVHKWHDPSAAEFLDEKAFYHSANKKA